MFTNYQFTAEIARQRHTEMIRGAERHHRLFRRPMVFEPALRAATETAHHAAAANDATVIALPAPRSSAHSPEARVA